MMPRNKNFEQGFVLITGLIFLIITTLLALSTIGSTTLQEKMASNLREKSRALEAADAALRDGEARLAQFNNYQPVGVNYDYDPTPQLPGNGDEVSWRLWIKDGPLAASPNFLNPATWGLAADSTPLPNDGTPRPDAYSPPFDTTLAAAPQLYIEELNYQPGSLRGTAWGGDTAGSSSTAVAIYRITSRAQGGNAAAVAITQSQYLQRY